MAKRPEWEVIYLIDHAVRYLPILRLLESTVSADASILEIGSGPCGVGEYYPHRFVGCDLSFSGVRSQTMLPVIASGLQLPFRDLAFDAVIASDVLEHVPPQHRKTLICEALRVSRITALMGFPCGVRAYALDQRLRSDWRRLKTQVPPWLEEHMLYPFPEEGLFEDVKLDWAVRSIGNDNLCFHGWLVRRTRVPRWARVFDMVERRIPKLLLQRVLRLADRAPYYRRIFTLTRRPVRA